MNIGSCCGGGGTIIGISLVYISPTPYDASKWRIVKDSQLNFVRADPHPMIDGIVWTPVLMTFSAPQDGRYILGGFQSALVDPNLVGSGGISAGYIGELRRNGHFIKDLLEGNLRRGDAITYLAPSTSGTAGRTDESFITLAFSFTRIGEMVNPTDPNEFW